MKPATTSTPAQTSPFHPQAAAATITDLMRPPLTAAGEYDHVAAAAYLMKHADTTALIVTDARTGQPAGILTQADIARATAAGKDPNNVRIHAVMTTRPAITTTTSIRDAATIMTTRHYRHLPVTSDTGLLGLIDITDLCQALSSAAESRARPSRRPRDRAAHPRRQTPAKPHNA